jgi:hypothetical protein
MRTYVFARLRVEDNTLLNQQIHLTTLGRVGSGGLSTSIALASALPAGAVGTQYNTAPDENKFQHL